MNAIKHIQTLAAELLELEGTFGANGEPPSEEAAAEWLRLIADFRAAHGLAQGSQGTRRRSNLRLPTQATAWCTLPSLETFEVHCCVVGRGGLGLSMNQLSAPVGTKLVVTEVEHLGKRYQVAAPGEVRWQQTVGAEVRVGVKFDTKETWSREVFSVWYLAVYQEYLRALARGEVEPLLGNESSRLTQGLDDDGEEGLARMLIVDDEPENLKLLERAFRNHFEIFTAPDGAKALEVALRVRPEVVITDQRMPSTSGVEFLRNLRQHLPETVRVLVTGYVDYPALVEAVNLAMVHHYAEKPVQINNLVSAVTALCDAKRPSRDS